jgi:hypothetical protein
VIQVNDEQAPTVGAAAAFLARPISLSRAGAPILRANTDAIVADVGDDQMVVLDSERLGAGCCWTHGGGCAPAATWNRHVGRHARSSRSADARALAADVTVRVDRRREPADRRA